MNGVIYTMPYRVGWFTDSHGVHRVRRLIEGTAAIVEAEKHHSFICWCQPPVHENTENALRRARDGWMERAEDLLKANKELQADNDLLRKYQDGDTWFYQGDGGDNIETMGANMVVVIHVSDLQELIRKGGK